MYNAYDFAQKNRPTTTIGSYGTGNRNNYSIIPVSTPQFYQNAYANSNAQLNQGLNALGQAAGEYLANRGNTPSSSTSSSILSSLMDSGDNSVYGAANNYITGNGTGYGSAISNAADDYVMGAGNYGGPNLGWVGAAQGAGRGLNSLVDTGDVNNAGQSFFNINSNDSEIGQALSGAANGAQMGSAFGPWGAVGGAVLGLGASFLDDI